MREPAAATAAMPGGAASHCLTCDRGLPNAPSAAIVTVPCVPSPPDQWASRRSGSTQSLGAVHLASRMALGTPSPGVARAVRVVRGSRAWTADPGPDRSARSTGAPLCARARTADPRGKRPQDRRDGARSRRAVDWPGDGRALPQSSDHAATVSSSIRSPALGPRSSGTPSLIRYLVRMTPALFARWCPARERRCSRAGRLADLQTSA